MSNQLFSSYHCFIITRALKRDAKCLILKTKKAFVSPTKIRFSVPIKAHFKGGAKPPNMNKNTFKFPQKRMPKRV